MIKLKYHENLSNKFDFFPKISWGSKNFQVNGSWWVFFLKNILYFELFVNIFILKRKKN
jgi:hypothetical protein